MRPASSSVERNSRTAAEELGDFTTTARVLPISLMAIGIGIVATFVAWFLLKLIGLFTNIFYYQRWDTGLSSPAGNHLGVFAIAVPVIGSLIVGLMARYGSERIRGHGIPEAIESILMNGSRVHPRLAILKPVSAAISVGSGRSEEHTSELQSQSNLVCRLLLEKKKKKKTPQTHKNKKNIKHEVIKQ